MIPPSATITGQAAVVDGFAAVGRAADDLTETHRAMLARLVPEVASRTPRRTGDLAASWSGGPSSKAATISSPLSYALPVEVGTVRMAGAHMVGDTLASSSDEIVKTYEDSLAAAAARAGFRISR